MREPDARLGREVLTGQRKRAAQSAARFHSLKCITCHLEKAHLAVSKGSAGAERRVAPVALRASVKLDTQFGETVTGDL